MTEHHPIISAAHEYVAILDEHQSRGPLLSGVRSAHQRLVDTVREHADPEIIETISRKVTGGAPARLCDECGREHPITRRHCRVCGSASLFVQPSGHCLRPECQFQRQEMS